MTNKDRSDGTVPSVIPDSKQWVRGLRDGYDPPAASQPTGKAPDRASPETKGYDPPVVSRPAEPVGDSGQDQTDQGSTPSSAGTEKNE